MKAKIITLVVVLLTFFGSAFAQQMPKTTYVAQPTLGTDRFRVYWLDGLVWPREAWLEVKFNAKGELTYMEYLGGSADFGTRFEYSFPTDNANTAFPDLKAWKEFAAKIRNEFVFVAPDTYVEKTPFVYVGKSMAIAHWETPENMQTLIFKKGERLLTVPMDKWVGPAPTVPGEAIVIGQSGDGVVFFPAQKTKTGYELPTEATKKLADNGNR